MSLLYTLEGWPSSPSSDNIARSFNNDSLVWSTAIATTPFTGQVTTTNFGFRQRGGWDGTFWYVIGPDGKLYRYNPTANTWSAALNGGVAVVTGAQTQHWTMASDGRFLYILDSAVGFRRYDPVADTLLGLAPIPGNAATGRMLLNYDGNGTIYGFRGGTDSPHQIATYSISSNTWTVLPNQATITTDLAAAPVTWSAFLQGAWWLFYWSPSAAKVWQYNPSNTTWTAKTGLSFAAAGILNATPYHEMTDAVIRIWSCNVAELTADYNVLTDSWTRGPVPPVQFDQGGNWAVNRVFAAAFAWFLSDGVTPASPNVAIGTVNQGGELVYEFQVQTPVSCPNGVQVSVPALLTTDAAVPVKICQTSGGTFGTSFTTAALAPNQFFTVFVKVDPTTQQTAGFNKTFNLHPVKL